MSDQILKRVGAGVFLVSWAFGSYLVMLAEKNLPWFVAPFLGIFMGLMVIMVPLVIIGIFIWMVGVMLGVFE